MISYALVDWASILDEIKENVGVLLFSLVASKTKLRGFSPQANYTNGVTAACRRKLVPNFRVVSATDSHGR
jgi:hypothetical protein